MKKITVLVVLLFMAGCSSSPSDEVIEEVIRSDMKKAVPILIIGNFFGGKLEELEEIDIEESEKKTWEPNVVGKTFGMKAYDYWLVTASVKGTGRIKDPFGLIGELRGFHARYTWGLKQNEDGLWIVLTTDFTQESLKQPANPSWWVIKDDKIKKVPDISTPIASNKKTASVIAPNRFVVRREYQSFTGKSYKPGDVLLVYSYKGEGYFNVEFNGETYQEDLGFSPLGGSTGTRCQEDTQRCWGELDKDLISGQKKSN